MMIVSVLSRVLCVIMLVILPEEQRLELDELSMLGFLKNQENRDSLSIIRLILFDLCLFELECSKSNKLFLKKGLKQFLFVSILLFLHLYILIENQVKSLSFELRCNSSCELRARDLVNALNIQDNLYKRILSQKLPAVIFGAREIILSINCYLYRCKRKRKKAYNNVYLSIGVTG